MLQDTGPHTIADLISMFDAGQVQDSGQGNLGGVLDRFRGAPSFVQSGAASPFAGLFTMAQPAAQPAQTDRPIDFGPNQYETVDPRTGMGTGFGSTSTPEGFEDWLLSMGLNPNAGSVQGGQQPATYGILNPNEFGFGFGNGVPGGNLLDYLAQIGYPDLNLATAMATGRPFQRSNMADAFAQLGGIGLPSLQSMQALGPSGYQMLMGLLTTFLGTSEEDALWGAMQPTRNLMGAPTARQVQGYIR